MDIWIFIISAILLSIERLCYFWIWRHPESFHAFCNHPAAALLGEPIEALEKLFYGFKCIQLSVFFGWCIYFGDTLVPLPSDNAIAVAAGSLLILIGQTLNFGVFYRLGRVGVFYGNKFGYQVPWCDGFPFSMFKHPQYIGTLISIWGFFLAIRFPHSDWIVLPMLQTAYYTLGAYVEH